MSSDNNSGRLVITDTSCLIILDKVGLLSILDKLFEVITTPEIAREYGHLPPWITVIPVKNKSFQDELADIVDSGEASAIALAHEVDFEYLITDDMDARKLCSKLKIKVIGTIGVLIRAKEQGHLPQIKPIIDQIRKTNFRMTDSLYETALRKAGEL